MSRLKTTLAALVFSLATMGAALAEDPVPSQKMPPESPTPFRHMKMAIPGVCGKIDDFKALFESKDMQLVYKGTTTEQPISVWLTPNGKSATVMIAVDPQTLCMVFTSTDIELNRDLLAKMIGERG